MGEDEDACGGTGGGISVLELLFFKIVSGESTVVGFIDGNGLDDDVRFRLPAELALLSTKFLRLCKTKGQITRSFQTCIYLNQR